MNSDMNTTIKAIFWDYDGTLVNTAIKNYNVTLRIFSEVMNRDPNEIPILRSINDYKMGLKNVPNWRYLYENIFGFTSDQTEFAAKYWTPFQLEDETPTPLFDGIKEVITKFSDIKQGIISQNSSKNISAVVKNHGLLEVFDCVIGYEDVDIKKQKPEPDGFLLCMEGLLTNNNDKIFYIGDSDTDINLVNNVNNSLSAKYNMPIISIGALYNNGVPTWEGKTKPDFIAMKAIDIIEIIETYK